MVFVINFNGDVMETEHIVGYVVQGIRQSYAQIKQEGPGAPGYW